MSRPTQRVSAKVALYCPERTHVVLTEYIRGNFGLPGGHLEENETPEEAIVREVQEELGVALNSNQLERKDFWRNPDGRIILGFVGTLPRDEAMNVDTNEIVDAKWAKIADIVGGSIVVDSYTEFITKNA